MISRQLVLISFAVALTASCNKRNDVECIFSKPLIIGASVSAGFKTKGGGPAAMIAQHLNPAAEIINKAKNGATSIQSIKNLDIDSIDPSVVIGLDLFFWDAARSQCGKEFEENTEHFFKNVSKLGIPMIIGEVPSDVDFPEGYRQVANFKCTAKINSFLREQCTKDKNCILYKAKDCIEHMGSPVNTKGEKYFIDKIHTSDEGNNFCVKEFINSSTYEVLSCSL